MATWHTPHSARAFWTDAAKLSDDTLTVYLTAARSACLAFAPLPAVKPQVQIVATFENGKVTGQEFRFSADLPANYTGDYTLPVDSDVNLVVTFANGSPVAQQLEGSIPEEYALAQVMHARNLYNAAKGATGPVDPETGWAAPVTTPLDWHVRQLLQPTTAFGGIA